MRFSLRSALLVFSMIIIALAYPISRYHSRLRAIAVIERRGGLVVFDDQDDGRGLLSELTGRVARVEFRTTRLDDQQLWAIGQFPEVQDVRLQYAHVTRADLSVLSKLPRLADLILFECQIERATIVELQKFPSLHWLTLAFSHGVTYDDVRLLADCPLLSCIDLRDIAITDQGLESLANRTNLTKVYISGGSVTTTGVEQLFRKSQLTVLIVSQNSFPDDWWAYMTRKYPTCKFIH